jgi:hypothetical protein
VEAAFFGSFLGLFFAIWIPVGLKQSFDNS